MGRARKGAHRHALLHPISLPSHPLSTTSSSTSSHVQPFCKVRIVAALTAHRQTNRERQEAKRQTALALLEQSKVRKLRQKQTTPEHKQRTRQNKGWLRRRKPGRCSSLTGRVQRNRE
ncbi:hypothetical protein J4Q44_G00308710 [Coregonus suidteri]|uniref:Uncharacterized protein n=1 Tax=Coregonus suidteri TaxID=861788 RepID=A0AAN8QI35_9TELE